MGELNSVIDNRVVCEAIKCTGYTWSAQPRAGGQQVARIYVCNEETSCNPFPDKADLECRSNFENLRAVYLWTYTYF